MNARLAALSLLAALVAAQPGCAAVAVTSAVVGAAVGVTTTVVGAAVGVGTAAGSAVVNAVSGGDDDDKPAAKPADRPSN